MKRNKNYKLIRLLCERGSNQRELANILELSYPAVQNRVNGRRLFTEQDIIRIKSYFGLTLTQIDDIFFQK